VRLDPTNSYAFAIRAYAYTLANEYKKAMDDCNTALRLNPQEAYAHELKAFVQTQLDNGSKWF